VTAEDQTLDAVLEDEDALLMRAVHLAAPIAECYAGRTSADIQDADVIAVALVRLVEARAEALLEAGTRALEAERHAEERINEAAERMVEAERERDRLRNLGHQFAQAIGLDGWENGMGGLLEEKRFEWMHADEQGAEECKPIIAALRAVLGADRPRADRGSDYDETRRD